MRPVFVVATAALFAAGSAFAQTTNPPAQTGPSNPAVKTAPGNNSNAPVAGANSFTMAQAKSRIEDKGYSQVSNLVKDKDGVWRGKAQKSGQPMDVSVDFQGNVVAKQPGAAL